MKKCLSHSIIKQFAQSFCRAASTFTYVPFFSQAASLSVHFLYSHMKKCLLHSVIKQFAQSFCRAASTFTYVPFFSQAASLSLFSKLLVSHLIESVYRPSADPYCHFSLYSISHFLHLTLLQPTFITSLSIPSVFQY